MLIKIGFTVDSNKVLRNPVKKKMMVKIFFSNIQKNVNFIFICYVTWQ